MVFIVPPLVCPLRLAFLNYCRARADRRLSRGEDLRFYAVTAAHPLTQLKHRALTLPRLPRTSACEPPARV